MPTLEEITERLRRALAQGEGLGRTVTLDLRGEGFVHVAAGEVVNEDRPADLRVSVSRADLSRLGKGELDPMRAMMTGRLRLSDMGLAMGMRDQIQSLFARLS